MPIRFAVLIVLILIFILVFFHILIMLIFPLIGILILIHNQAKMEAMEAARLRMQARYDQVGFLIEFPSFIC